MVLISFRSAKVEYWGLVELPSVDICQMEVSVPIVILSNVSEALRVPKLEDRMI